MALKLGAASWEIVGRLPRPLAYGVSVTTTDGVLCAGGSDSQTHYASVFLLKLRQGMLETEPLRPLPKTVAMAAGAKVGDMVYVAGGLESPLAADPLNTFFALYLRNLEFGWRTLPSWPGPGRSQAVAAGSDADFYLFSGMRHENDAKGERTLKYLKDAYRYRPKEGWIRLPDLPYAAAAAASPAPVAEGRVVVSGADGSGAGRSPLEFHPAPRRIQEFSIAASIWSDAGHAPVGRICVSAVKWGGRLVLPTGERSAGVRSPEVWSWMPK